MPMDIDETPKKSPSIRVRLPAGFRLKRPKPPSAMYAAIPPGPAAIFWLPIRWSPSAGAFSASRNIVEEASSSLHLLSGRSHMGLYRRLPGHAADARSRQKIVETKVRFKRLSGIEIKNYLASGEWRGKAGGYGIQGFAGTFMQKMWAPTPAVVGLPLYETILLLTGEGFDVHSRWPEG